MTEVALTPVPYDTVADKWTPVYIRSSEHFGMSRLRNGRYVAVLPRRWKPSGEPIPLRVEIAKDVFGKCWPETIAVEGYTFKHTGEFDTADKRNTEAARDEMTSAMRFRVEFRQLYAGDAA